MRKFQNFQSSAIRNNLETSEDGELKLTDKSSREMDKVAEDQEIRSMI